MKKKWKAPVMIPGMDKNDPLAELSQEEGAIRGPQMAPGFWDLPEDERVNGVMSANSGLKNLLQQKKDATAAPEQAPKPRDNMTSPAPQIIIQTQPPAGGAPRNPVAQPDMMQMLARRMSAQPGVSTMPTNVGDLRSAIYGTRPQQAQAPINPEEQDPDALMAMIAQRFRGGLRR